jgi:MFS family permease
MQTAFGAFVTVQLLENHWPIAAIGFALSISALGSLLSQVPAGAFIDSIADKRRAVRVGTVAVGIAALLLASASHRPVVYVAQALLGVGSALIGPGIAAISLALVGHAQLSERLGRNARYASIGNGMTAGVMGLFGAWFSPAAVFLLASLLAIPTLFALAVIRPGQINLDAEIGAEAKEARFTWKGLGMLFLDRRLLLFAGCIILYFAASGALMPGVAAQVTRDHPEGATLIVAATILVPQFVVAALSPWVGRTAERTGRRPLLLLGWGLIPVQGLLYAFAPGPYTLVICQLLNGLSGAVFGVLLALVAADLTRGTGRFNLTLGALGVAMSVGASASTFAAGIMAGAFGGTIAYLGLAFSGACGFVLLWWAMPETRPVPAGKPELATLAQSS